MINSYTPETKKNPKKWSSPTNLILRRQKMCSHLTKKVISTIFNESQDVIYIHHLEKDKTFTELYHAELLSRNLWTCRKHISYFHRRFKEVGTTWGQVCGTKSRNKSQFLQNFNYLPLAKYLYLPRSYNTLYKSMDLIAWLLLIFKSYIFRLLLPLIMGTFNI